MLNRLQRLLPEGLLADAAWLTSMGYPSSLRSRYVGSGWLRPVTRGVFRRPFHRPGLQGTETPLRWQHVVVSLQMVLERPVAVGGRTALELGGFGHYVSSAGSGEIHPLRRRGGAGVARKAPGRDAFRVSQRPEAVSRRADFRCLDSLKAVLASDRPTRSEPVHGSLTWTHFGDGDWPLVLSTPERAILELLDQLPDRETFHQADVLMEGLVNLCPERLVRVLRECRSVKVKRLFLWFAERHGHAWRERLDLAKVDLGRGKRMLVRGGKLDPTYLITVPADLDAGG